MVESPKISIIIPAYNSAETIGACLESIFNQTFKDFEVIVVDDGSTDDLTGALKPWLNVTPPQPSPSKGEGVIKYFKQENCGAASARNRGFGESRGEYVIFCDADVVMERTMLEKMFDTLEKNQKVAYAYSSFKFGFKKFPLWPFDAGKLKQMPYIHTTSLICRDKFPGFDESLKRFQDWDLWLTMLEKGESGVFIDEFLFSVKSGGTMSAWLPKFFYKLSWLKAVKKYQEAEEIIKKKHRLSHKP